MAVNVTTPSELVGIVHVFIDSNYQLSGSVNTPLVILALVASVGIYWLTRKSFENVHEIEATEIGIGSHKIKIKPNYEDLQIAYQLWVELSTRKIGLLIDPNEDVLEEVYNSWYEFFKKSREVIKGIPVSKLRSNKGSEQIAQVAIDVLNKELRPHLTKWQAKFRRWYEAAKLDPANKDRSPQDIQKDFPEFDALIQDLVQVNKKLANYMNFLKKVSHNIK